MSNPILDWLEKRNRHRELLARWDALEKQAHTGMVFYELSEGHREAVTEKLKSDIERLRNDFAKANIKPPDDMVELQPKGTRNCPHRIGVHDVRRNQPPGSSNRLSNRVQRGRRI
jgi:hypothetical protein